MALPNRAVESDFPRAPEQPEVPDLRWQPRVRVRCVLCGSSRSRLVCSAEAIASQREFLERFSRGRWRELNDATATDRLVFTQDYATAVVACVDCGLLYRSPRPRTQAVTTAYRAERYDGAYLWAEFDAQRRWAKGKASTLSRYARRPADAGRLRVLEIGSFVGGFLAEGTARGWDVLGVDPGRDVTAFCRGQRLPALESTIEEAHLPPASFDAIAVWNTFDQLPDPHVLLKHAVPLLRDGGILVVRVPNGACFDWAMTLKKRLPVALTYPLDLALAWNNLLTFPYLYGYSAPALERLTAPYGFRLRACLPDQVAATPAGHLTWRGRWEERGVKAMCRLGATLWQDDRHRSAPWLDLYFERACAVWDRPNGDTAALGIVPVYSPMVFEDTDAARPGIPWN